MGKDLKVPDIIAKLQRHRGYQGWRMSPHWRKTHLWIVEYSTYLGHGNKKGWRVLRDEEGQYRIFSTPELAYTALAKQHAVWQQVSGIQDQTFQVDDKDEKRLGRIYPFCYQQFQESEEALADLLRTSHDETIWLLDIRFDPEDSWSGFHGSSLKQVRPSQYRHAKGLGLVNGQLSNPSSAVCKILQLLQEGESFVIFSGDFDHVNMIEALIRDEAGKQGLLLGDPYTLHAGDLCIWQKREVNAPQIEIVLHHRTSNVYVFLGHIHHTEVINEYVDICDLTLVEKGAYLCEECKKGVETTKWRDQAEKKLCAHCFWLWDLKEGKY